MKERYPGKGVVHTANILLGRPRMPKMNPMDLQKANEEALDNFHQNIKWYKNIHHFHGGKDLILGLLGSILTANIQHNDYVTAIPAVIFFSFYLVHAFHKGRASDKEQLTLQQFETRRQEREAFERRFPIYTPQPPKDSSAFN